MDLLGQARQGSDPLAARQGFAALIANAQAARETRARAQYQLEGMNLASKRKLGDE